MPASVPLHIDDSSCFDYFTSTVDGTNATVDGDEFGSRGCPEAAKLVTVEGDEFGGLRTASATIDRDAASVHVIASPPPRVAMRVVTPPRLQSATRSDVAKEVMGVGSPPHPYHKKLSQVAKSP